MNDYFEIHDGFVRIVDCMGDDMAVVRAARVSYGQESKGEKADKGLINYMMKHNHGTPFEHIVFTFHIKCPIFVARQWFRHRIGSFNEISGRYVELENDVYFPEKWRKNTSTNQQISNEHKWNDGDSKLISHLYYGATNTCIHNYKKLLELGVAREQARMILPLAQYTEFYWTVNARSLMNFIKLRSSPDAQLEIQEYSNIIRKIAFDAAPWTFEAFEKR